MNCGGSTISSALIFAMNPPWARGGGDRLGRRGDVFRRFAVRGGATRSLKIRGELTIAACSGCASGTLMTSMRNSAELGSLSGVARTHPDSSLGERTPAEPEM